MFALLVFLFSVFKVPPHTLSEMAFRLSLIGDAEGVLLAADKGTDYFNVFGVIGGWYLPHLGDPVTL